MDASIFGLMTPTEDFKKKVAAWKACKAAGITIPDQLLNYFSYGEPDDDKGMMIPLNNDYLGTITKYQTSSADGYDIDLTKLPEGVTVIRIFKSY